MPEPWTAEELSPDDVVTRLRLRAMTTARPDPDQGHSGWVARGALQGRHARLLAVCLAVLVAVVGAWMLARTAWGQGPAVSPPATGQPGLATPAATPSTPAAASADPSEAGAMLTVHVVGQVQRPGLLTLKAGSRVADAVAAAGGATDTADLEAINLARPLTDGEQVLVPAPGEAVAPPPPGPAPAGGGVAAPGSAVNLNTATAAELDALPGIGPVLAQRIVQYRTDNGSFGAVEDLADVSGIGPALLEELGGLVTV